MKSYKKYIFIFLRAVLISVTFGITWLVTFDGFDLYAEEHLKPYRSNFFFDIVLFFLSGLVSAFIFYVLMRFLEKLLEKDIKAY
jgi:biotin transporter BioY